MLIALIPAATSCRRITSMIGRSCSGISGFGNTVVYGASRVPRPPAITTANMSDRSWLHADTRSRLHPLDHGPDPVAQARARLPVVGGAKLRRASQELEYLAWLGPEPRLVGPYCELATYELANQIDDLRDGDVDTRADVERLSRMGSTRAELDEGIHSVADVDE